MASQREVLSVVVALQFVLVAVAVFLLVPLEDAVSVVPLFLLLLVALYAYRH